MNLSKDITQNVALYLDPQSITALCQTNSELNHIICRDEYFWYNKIIRDYPTRAPTIIENGNRIVYNYGLSWKEIYHMLTERSALIELNRTVSGNFYTQEDLDTLIQLPLDYMRLAILNDITETVNMHNNDPNIRKRLVLRGDVIVLSWVEGYRNDGKLIWDGEKAIPLEYDLDEYGNVPRSMQFPEFPPDHFTSISHNRIFHLSQASKEELKRNYDIETMTSYVTDQYKIYQFKIYNENELYTISLFSIPDELLGRLEYETDETGNIIIHLSFEISAVYNNMGYLSINEIPDYMNDISTIVFNTDAEVVWNNNRFTIRAPKQGYGRLH